MAGHAKKKTMVSVKTHSRKTTVNSVRQLGDFCSVATLFITETLKANWSEKTSSPYSPQLLQKAQLWHHEDIFLSVTNNLNPLFIYQSLTHSLEFNWKILEELHLKTILCTYVSLWETSDSPPDWLIVFSPTRGSSCQWAQHQECFSLCSMCLLVPWLIMKIT